MRPRAATLVAAGQASFVALVGLCVALEPGLVLKRDEGGISNFGVHAASVVPYSLAFALDAGFLVLAARRLEAPADRRLRRVLEVLAALLVVTLLTTYGYTSSRVLTHVHDTVGAVLVLYQCAVVEWLRRRARLGVAGSVLVAVTFLGLALCILASAAVWHVLFAGQVLVIAGFAPIVIGAARAAN
jgi:hypothetical protein